MAKGKKSTSTPWGLILGILMVATLALGARLWIWQDHQGRQGGAVGGPFTLIDGDGKTVTDQDFKGRWLLIYFGYTFCPDICPTALSVMTAALDRLPPDQVQRLTPLFITIDPARDTPAVMKDYVTAFHPRLIGLTGSDAQIAAVAKAYKVHAVKAKSADPTAYTMDHSSILYLVGPDGRFVTHFPHAATAADIAAGLTTSLGGP